MQVRTLFSIAISLFFIAIGSAQYLETFSVPNRGVLSGPCSGSDGTTCTSNNFNGVDWTVNGNLTGIDADDFAQTQGAGFFEIGGDVDEETCIETPVLDISTVSGTASLAVDLTWDGHDASDYIDVEYSIDGGGWIQIPNQAGGGTHTIDFTTSGNSGNTTVTQGGLNGSTLSIRICADTNTSSEGTQVDNISVPQAGAMVLPVTWGTIGAIEKNKHAIITWSTFSEINNDYFVIERATKNLNVFKPIGMVDGEGYSDTKIDYQFIDETPEAGENLYRIQQVDLDGSFEYSEITSINFTSNQNQINAFPNPFSSTLILSLSNISSPIAIVNSTGQVFYNSSTNQDQLQINTQNWPAGIYFLINESSCQKFVKQ